MKFITALLCSYSVIMMCCCSYSLRISRGRVLNEYSLRKFAPFSVVTARNGLKYPLTRLSANSGESTDWPVDRVRSQFVDYFVRSKDHMNYKSSPSVPVNDPTLLFANAGMNQFKSIFVGTVDPSSPLASLKRAVNSQKCIRAGGKHNDLDDVGKDTYHHTFFEMLGTWSFGDYFKKEAIEWAYDILVNKYGLDKDRLYASYFGGDEELGLPCDEEARDLWLQFLPAERVLPFDKKDNFWEMGDTGPCGPCSEVHYDRIGGGRDAASLVNADDPDVIEIWNLVFIQYNRESDGGLRQLPNKHIDTGMGLERLTSILQEKRSNYDTDAFMPIFRAIREVVSTGSVTSLSSGSDSAGPGEELLTCPAYSGKVGEADAAQNFRDTAYRIVADHVRTLTFAIADGAVPSNEGRGYVLRRVLRRAVRYGVQTLGARPGFFSQLVPIVAQEMGTAYPELIEKQAEVVALVREEEMAFTSLLERGVKYFKEVVEEVQASGRSEIEGEKAFFMYDTLGFPVDLTQLMAEERGLTVDVAGFQAAMQKQKERSRVARRMLTLANRAGNNVDLTLAAEQVSQLQNEWGALPTDDSHKYSETDVEASIVAIYSGSESSGGKGFVRSIGEIDSTENTIFGIVLDKTSFYPEAGGQVADTGRLMFVDVDAESGEDGRMREVVLDVLDVQTYGGFVVHTCALAIEEETEAASRTTTAVGVDFTDAVKRVAVGSGVKAAVDYLRRRKVAPNHTMTHVLNYALRKVIGGVIDQKGSQVSDEKLRFDFSLNRAVSAEELVQVEELVNSSIKDELEVYNKVVPLEQATRINGLRAVFGEVYPDPVRVLAVGPQVEEMVLAPKEDAWMEYSVEFCGGTHIANTREAQAFVIQEETAVAKGIRRISAVTGEAALAGIARAALLTEQVHSAAQRVARIKARAVDPDEADREEGRETEARAVTEADREVVALRQELEKVSISQASKTNLREQLEALQRDLIVLKNQQMMRMVDSAIKAVIEDVKARSEKGERTAVLRMSIGSDSKAVKRAIEAIKKAAPELSFLCISDELTPAQPTDTPSNTDAESAKTKLTVFSYVTDAALAQNSNNNDSVVSPSSAASLSGLKANEWLSAALQAAGGRGGGKPGMAQGSCMVASRNDIAVVAAAAEKFAGSCSSPVV